MRSYQDILRNVVTKHPLVHCITNYVTINDCANILLACGGSPIMADDPLESAEVTAICQGLVINTGTLHEHTVKAMLHSGKTANRLGIPVILDPVGAGVSEFRRSTVQNLLTEIQFSVIRGNLSEIRCLYTDSKCSRGVDANQSDLINTDISEAVLMSRELSKQTNAVIAVSGAVDVISDANDSCLIANGSDRMARITGSGCMLSAVIGGYAAANPDNIKTAVEAAVLMHAVSGEIAAEKSGSDGIGSFCTALLDTVDHFTDTDHYHEIERRARVERI